MPRRDRVAGDRLGARGGGRGGARLRDRAASDPISPFGSRLNRVFLAGTLSPVGNRSAGTETRPFWRARLTDPTGTVTVTAGELPTPSDGPAPRGDPGPGRPGGRQGPPLPRARRGGLRLGPVGSAPFRHGVGRTVRPRRGARPKPRPARPPRPPPSRPRAGNGNPSFGGYPDVWLAAARESLRRYPDADRSPFRASLGAAVQRVAGRTGWSLRRLRLRP